MAEAKKSKRPSRPPAKTPEARENQLISAAVDLAEKQIAEGTASAAVITHYLKLGSSREKIEQERLRMQVELDQAKTQAMASEKKNEQMMEEAMRAFRAYHGEDVMDDLDD